MMAYFKKFCFLHFFVAPLLFGGPVVLVTGGAGYIGSHICKALNDAGFTPVVYDSLVWGEREFVKWGPLVVGDLLDEGALDQVFGEHKPCAVIHCAGLRDVRESVENPALYYANNVTGSLNLLNAMRKHEVGYIIFSSSCCVYGDVGGVMSETNRKEPTNPYAVSKFVIERIIADYAAAYSMKYVALRYFNAVGVEAGLTRSTRSLGFLIPRALQSCLQSGAPLQIFGTDYPTRDGTTIRDYIHVKDLANGHILSLQYLLNGGQSEAFNLGTGEGHSVLEILQVMGDVIGKRVSYEKVARREGDLIEAIADAEKAKRILNFTPHFSDLHTIIESEWVALRNLPN